MWRKRAELCLFPSFWNKICNLRVSFKFQQGRFSGTAANQEPNNICSFSLPLPRWPRRLVSFVHRHRILPAVLRRDYNVPIPPPTNLARRPSTDSAIENHAKRSAWERSWSGRILCAASDFYEALMTRPQKELSKECWIPYYRIIPKSLT